MYDRNNYIKARTLMVVVEGEGNIGIISKEDALAEARKRDLDLVLINPQSDPPVAKIMSWSKFKYDLSKKQKGNKKNKSEVKEMQFKPFIGEGDIEHKVRQIKKFIDDNNKVKIKVRYKRPATPEKIDETMSKIELLVTEFADIDIPRKKEGRDLAIYIKSK